MRSRLRVVDVLALGTVGLRSRRLRAALSTVGIAVGIAAIVAVLGVTRSSQADLLARIDALGTDLLTVTAGAGFGGGDGGRLPPTAAASIARTDGVLACAPTAELAQVRVYRTDRVPPYNSNGLA